MSDLKFFETVNSVLAELERNVASKYPKMFLYQGASCQSCKNRGYVWPIYDSSGMPRTTWMYSLIQVRKRAAGGLLEGGVIPYPDGKVIGDERGFAISVEVKMYGPIDAFREDFIAAAEKLNNFTTETVAA